MIRLLVVATGLALLAPATLQAKDDATTMEINSAQRQTFDMPYPATRRGDVVEVHFGEKLADPYRWLENDVRTDEEVAAWVDAQNQVTHAYLDLLPANGWFKNRLGELLDYERFGIPQKAGSRYFYSYNSGLLNQSQLFMRDGLGGKGRLLIDPNLWSKDDATALAGYQPSPEGRWLAYLVQDGGSDWRTIRVFDVTSGKLLPDKIEWAKFTGIAWVGDDGFFYSRFPETEGGQDFQSLNYNQAIYFHRLGTPQSEDRPVYATPKFKERGHGTGVTSDGRWAFIFSSTGTDARFEVHYIDLSPHEPSGWKVRTLVPGFENSWNLIDTIGSTAYFVTNKGAPRYRVVKTDLAAADPQWTEVIAETAQPIDDASIVGDRLVLTYLKDASTRVATFDLAGNPQKDIDLGELGTAAGFNGEPGDSETFYRFTSFNRPGTIFRLDLASGTKTVFAEPKLNFDPDRYRTEQVFYTSKDGTRVPMFIVRRKDITGPAPTLLYGYGGFDISLTPSYSSTRMAWLEAGGVFALANIRGGGEYGKQWHDAGRRANKQNVFDDFIAAGEYLKAKGYTPKDGLAIQGGSNGSLLMGAVLNQRPDLFDAANAAVGVMDMLRFHLFTAGRYWVDDYGNPEVEADWKVLRAYSPYHNIHSGMDYPPILVTTADTDDRVVPGHSFKYTAALQHADLGDAPHLIRVETRAGHGSGKPTDKIIAESGDVLSFLAFHTGLEVPSGK